MDKKEQKVEYWRNLAVNSAKKWRLEDEILKEFNKLVKLYPPELAAFHACYEWDIELVQS